MTNPINDLVEALERVVEDFRTTRRMTPTMIKVAVLRVVQNLVRKDDGDAE